MFRLASTVLPEMSEPRYPSDAHDRFLVRMPDGMRDRIAEQAKANNRSMNAEIVARLQASESGGLSEIDRGLLELDVARGRLELSRVRARAMVLAHDVRILVQLLDPQKFEEAKKQAGIADIETFVSDADEVIAEYEDQPKQATHPALDVMRRAAKLLEMTKGRREAAKKKRDSSTKQ